MAVGVVTELDGGWGPEVKSCGVSVVELLFIDFLLGACMRKEVLVMGSERVEELVLCESKVVKEKCQAIGRTEPERREFVEGGLELKIRLGGGACLRWH